MISTGYMIRVGNSRSGISNRKIVSEKEMQNRPENSLDRKQTVAGVCETRADVASATKIFAS